MLESIGSSLENLRMTWGGRWTTPYDPWHVQGYSSTKEYLEYNPELKPILKNFLSDYKNTYQKTKEPKLKELIEFLES